MNDKRDHSGCLDCSFWRSFNPDAICPKCFDGICNCPKTFAPATTGTFERIALIPLTGLGVATTESAAPSTPRGSTPS